MHLEREGLRLRREELAVGYGFQASRERQGSAATGPQRACNLFSKTPKIGFGPCGPGPSALTLQSSLAFGRSIMQLKIATHTRDGITVLECNGRIVFGDEAAALREQVKDLIAAGKKQVVLNLGGITYIDSGGLGTLVGLYTTARNAGGSIRLANLTQRVGDLLQVTKLLTVFDVYDSEEKAIKAFGTAAVA